MATTEWENILKSYIQQRTLFRNYKKFFQLSNRKAKSSILKVSKNINRYFTKEDIQMTDIHIKMFNINQ